VQEDTPSTEEKDEQTFLTTRSGQISCLPEKLTFPQAHYSCEEYSIKNAKVIAVVMCCANDILMNLGDIKAHQFVQSYTLIKTLKDFGEKEGKLPERDETMA
jgi:hypothetical protein